MKRYFITLIAVLSIVSFLGSCQKMWDKIRGVKLVDSYILAYYEIGNGTGLLFRTSAKNGTVYFRAVKSGYENRLADARSMGGANYDKEDAVLFDSLRVSYGDTGYPDPYKTLGYIDGTPLDPAAFTETFVDISIVSDTDWGDDYPAGTVLNDLFDIDIASFAPYIESGYDPAFEIGREESLSPFKYSSTVRLSELDEAGMSLLNAFHPFRLSVPEKDAVKGSRLTISMETSAGERFERIVEVP